jgi:tRNA pseudouridine55 synthase
MTTILQPSLEEGVLLLDKPAGKTSFYLVHILRQITGIKKIGHAGTLDPFATGVMVMLIGKSATRCSDLFLSDDKEYLATLHLGFTTPTYDCDSPTTLVSERVPSLLEIQQVLAQFQGTLLQTPPMYSAKKIQGKKLYELARKGIEIERSPQTVHVHITLVEYNYPYLTLEVTCSKGTYIRSLAHDIGQKLQIGAYLEKLIRLRSGQFLLEDCINFHTLQFTSFNYKHHLIGVPCKSSHTIKM